MPYIDYYDITVDDGGKVYYSCRVMATGMEHARQRAASIEPRPCAADADRNLRLSILLDSEVELVKEEHLGSRLKALLKKERASHFVQIKR